HGAIIDAKDDAGTTPLMIAVSLGNIELVELLLNAHANIDATDNDGSTPIQIAAYHGQIAIVEKLLSSGADTNARRP
ncbi:unnamed protein product, partial [Aphanomyces euteiches]